jgi:hypothetical protein
MDPWYNSLNIFSQCIQTEAVMLEVHTDFFLDTKEWGEAFISGELNDNEPVDCHQWEDKMSSFKTGLISLDALQVGAPSLAWVPRHVTRTY